MRRCKDCIHLQWLKEMTYWTFRCKRPKSATLPCGGDFGKDRPYYQRKLWLWIFPRFWRPK